jgi:hypothetical protein
LGGARLLERALAGLACAGERRTATVRAVSEHVVAIWSDYI